LVAKRLAGGKEKRETPSRPFQKRAGRSSLATREDGEQKNNLTSGGPLECG